MTNQSDRVQFTLVDTGEQQFITVYVPGRDPLSADDTHPCFDEILAGALEGEDVSDLFDVSEAVSQKFHRLSERVTVENGRVYFDGDEQDDTITRQIVKALDEDREFDHLVAFMEKVAANPTEHSRTQLYDWLRQEGLRLTDSGDIIGYKAVQDGKSIHSGSAIVNGESVNGRVPNRIGDVIEMPRSQVAHDPSASCSRGLHVATKEYARSFGGRTATILEVHVNPRDVVSVPTDADGEKVRVCRYTVAAVAELPQAERAPAYW